MMQFLSIPLALAIVATSLPSVDAHGYMFNPPVRGLLRGDNLVDIPIIDPTAEKDFSRHFPAGDKNTTPGSGLRSQKAAAGPGGYTPYNPYDKDFVFRAGVCGDLKTGNEHLRGGKFYNNATVVAEYEQGGVISVDIAIIAHHNGFMELHLCDVDKHCDGEISEECFQNGGCQPLNRAFVQSCETRTDLECGPVDPEFPGRFHIPCPSGNDHSLYGKGKIQYQLPKDIACEHCVLQWYWVSANSCNPVGVLDYFKGPRGPQWGTCEGQGSAVGGFRPFPQLCEGERFSEEYYQCADIKINANRNVAAAIKTTQATEISAPTPTKEVKPSTTLAKVTKLSSESVKEAQTLSLVNTTNASPLPSFSSAEEVGTSPSSVVEVEVLAITATEEEQALPTTVIKADKTAKATCGGHRRRHHL